MDPMRQFPDVLGSNPALRHCHQCGQSQDRDSNLQLRKCGGCSRSLYCSKTCQKAAWPNHKLLCGKLDRFTGSPIETIAKEPSEPSSGFPSNLGFPSLPALSKALQDFTEVHNWTFRSLAKANVLLHGGVDWALNARKVFCFHLVPTAAVGVRERNPSRTFRLGLCFFDDMENLGSHASNPIMKDWACREPLRKRAEEAWRLRNPDYVGLLPMTFTVDGLDMIFVVHCPLFRPTQLRNPIPLFDDNQAKRVLLEDIVTLTGSSINTGIHFLPVKSSSGLEGMMVALPG